MWEIPRVTAPFRMRKRKSSQSTPIVAKNQTSFIYGGDIEQLRRGAAFAKWAPKQDLSIGVLEFGRKTRGR